LRLGWLHVFDLADPLDRLMLENVASKPINGVGGIDDNTAIQQTFYNGFDISGLGIIRMEMQQHTVIY
jgi:hypothetical protein